MMHGEKVTLLGTLICLTIDSTMDSISCIRKLHVEVDSTIIRRGVNYSKSLFNWNSLDKNILLKEVIDKENILTK